MAKGEEIYEDFVLIKDNPVEEDVVLDIPTAKIVECPFTLNVLADDSNDDEFRNDKTSVLFRYTDAVTAVELRLQQKQGSVWVDVDVLNNDDVGTFSDLGFIEDEKGRKYIGYLIDWREVLTIHGEGIFRVRTYETTIFGSNNRLSFEWCLKRYTAERADGTVKIETITNRIRGDIDNELDYIDFGDTDWYNSFRLCGVFGFDTSEYVQEHTIYSNGSKEYIKDEQIPKYIFKSGRMPGWLHNIVKTDILQADYIFITDYNKYNPNTHIKRPVKRDGNYAPKWDEKVRSKFASVEVQFENRYDNLRKLRC